MLIDRYKNKKMWILVKSYTQKIYFCGCKKNVLGLHPEIFKIDSNSIYYLLLG